VNTVTLSKEYQLIIPEEISKSIGLEPGSSFEVLPYNNRIELIPISPIKEVKGIFKGIDTNIERDDDRV
jgi:AbrB family looped-hinge helix DNA binding protein